MSTVTPASPKGLNPGQKKLLDRVLGRIPLQAPAVTAQAGQSGQ